MGRASSIDRLPRELRELIGRLRQDGQTIDSIMAHLSEMEAGVSRSALGRHVQKIDRLGARLRQSRVVAEALARELGDAPGDQVARLNIEVLHSFISDVFASAGDETEEGDKAMAALRDPKGAALFAEAVERLTKASRHNQEFVERIEKRATAKAKAEAAGEAEAGMRDAGLSNSTIEKIKKRILGIG